MGARKAKYRGRLVSLPNPSECARTRKPVAEITDRAKRYRANQAGCRPAGPKRCLYCGRGAKHMVIDHMDGDESNGRRSNLAWACKACNTRLGAAMKSAGRGVRTRQYNAVPDFKQYAWAIGMICRRRDMEAGRCSPSNYSTTAEAVAIIRATPAAKRREYARRAASSRGRWSSRDEVPF